MICTQDHGQYLTDLCLFVYNHGIKVLIIHDRDSIHNCEYQNFYYHDSIILYRSALIHTLANCFADFLKMINVTVSENPPC